MALHLQPVTLSDRASIAHILVLANRDDPLAQAAYPTSSLEDRIASSHARFPSSLFAQNSWHLKVVDHDTGETVSYSKWRLPVELWLKLKRSGEGWGGANVGSPREEDTEKYDEEYRRAMNGYFPKGMDEDLVKTLEKRMRVAREKFPSGESVIILEKVKTLPSHQRRGAASMMLQWAIDLADHHRLKICLEATPLGVGLYKKFGFKTVTEVAHNLVKWGGPERYKHTLMVRSPNCRNESIVS